MPSVASESAAVLSSRSSLPGIRNQADAGRNQPGTSFSDLLDSAADAASQSQATPPQGRDAPAKHADNGGSAGTKPAQGGTGGQDAKDAKSAKSDDSADAADASQPSPDAADGGKSAATDKAGLAKLTTAIDTDADTKTDATASGDAADKAQPAADPNAAVTAPIVTTATPPVPVAAPQVAAATPVAAPADTEEAGVEPLAALEAAAAGQGQRAAAPAKPAAADSGKPANAGAAKPVAPGNTKAADVSTPIGDDAPKPEAADAKPAADARTAEQIEAAKNGQPRGDSEKPAANVHRAATDLLAKADAPSAQAGGDAAASVKAGADAAQAIGAASQTAAPTANAATNPASAITTTQAQVQATAVPLSGVAFEISTQAGAGKNHFEIRLDPPELGRIDVKLDVDRDGNVSTRLVVDRSETLDLLKRDAPALERALQQAGLKTSDHGLDFSLRQQTSQQNDNAQGNTNRIVIPDDEPAPLDAPRQTYGRLLGMGGGLDIRV